MSRPTGWLVTPTQAIMGRKGPFKYRLYFGAGGLAFGLAVGVISGIRIGRNGGDHGASTKGPRTIKAPAGPRPSPRPLRPIPRTSLTRCSGRVRHRPLDAACP